MKKRYLLSLLFCLLMASAFGQGNEYRYLWNKVIAIEGGLSPSSEFIRAVQYDRHGNVYAAGSWYAFHNGQRAILRTNFGETPLNQFQSSDRSSPFLASYDATGKPRFQGMYSNAYNVELTAHSFVVSPYSDVLYYAVSTSIGSSMAEDPNQYHAGSVTKINSDNGNQIWSANTVYSGQFASTNNYYGLDVDPADNLFVGGSTYGLQGNMSFGNTTNANVVFTAPTSPNGFIYKLNADGSSYAWFNRLAPTPTTSISAVKAVAYHPSNTMVYAAGWLNGTIDFDPSAAVKSLSSSGPYDFFMARYNSSTGALDSVVTLVSFTSVTAPSVTNEINQMKVDADGNIYVGGYFAGTADFDPSANETIISSTNLTRADAFIAKYSPDFELLWVKTLLSSENNSVNSIGFYNNQVVLSGFFNGTVNFGAGGAPQNLVSSSSIDGFIWILDTNGNYIDAKRFGTTTDNLTNGAVGPFGEFTYSSTFTFNMDIDFGSGTTPLNPSIIGQRDALLVSFALCQDFEVTQTNDGDNICTGAANILEVALDIPQTGAVYNWYQYDANNDPQLIYTGPSNQYEFVVADTVSLGTQYRFYVDIEVSGCSFSTSSGDFTVTVSGEFDAPVIIRNSVNVLSASGGAGNYEWYFNNGAVPFATGNQVTLSQNGTYKLRSTDALTGCTAFSESIAYEAPIFVDPTATGAGNGSSWQNAFTDVNAAITAASNGDILWLKGGTYNLVNTIGLTKELRIYGSFSGTESDINDRDLALSPTIFNARPTGLQALFYTVDVNNAFREATINGIHFINNGRTLTNPSAAIWVRGASKVIIENCEFRNNLSFAGAAVNKSTNGQVIIRNSLFENNASQYGGLFSINGDVSGDIHFVVVNSVFRNNEARGNNPSSPGIGGIMYVYGNVIPDPGIKVDFINNTAVNNTATQADYVFVKSRWTTINTYNSVFDVASPGQLVRNDGFSGIFATLNFYNNAYNGDYQGGQNQITLFDNNNLGRLFSAGATGEINPCLPIINLGISNATTDTFLPATDFAGNQRIVGGAIDLGAYEAQTIGNLLEVISSVDPEYNVCIGDPLTLTAEATGDNVTYSWYKGAVLVSATASLEFEEISLDDFGDYRLVLSSDCGAAQEVAFALISNSDLAFDAPLQLTIDCVGQDLTINSTASTTAGVLNYQWFKNGVAIAGATNANLVIENSQIADQGIYTLTISDDCFVINSEEVNAAFTFGSTEGSKLITQNNSVVCVGSDFTLNSNVGGSPNAYQWYKNEEVIEGETGANLILTNLTSDADYYVIVSESCFLFKSEIITVQVSEGGTITSISPAQSACIGNDISLGVVVNGIGTVSYQWFVNGQLIANANDSDFFIQNASLADFGTYAVEISDDCGTITSDPIQVALAQIDPTLSTQLDLLLSFDNSLANTVNTEQLGTIPVGTLAYTTDLFGNANSAISLNGSTGILAPANEYLGEEFTVAMFINIKQYVEWARLFDIENNVGQNQATFGINFAGTNQLWFGNSATGQYLQGPANLVPSLNNWVHIAFTRHANGDAFIYYNGEQIASRTNMPALNSARTAWLRTYIGRTQAQPPSQWLNADLDDFRVYSKALSASQISQLSLGTTAYTPNGTRFNPNLLISASGSVCVGDNVTLTVPVVDLPENMEIVWFKNGQLIPGVSGVSITLNNLSGADLVAEYSIGITEGCISEVGPAFTLNSAVGANPLVEISANNAEICPNGTLILTANLTDFEAASFMWFKDGAEIMGQISSVLEINNFAEVNVGAYSVIAFNNCGQIESTEFEISIVPALEFIIQPNASYEICEGDALTLTAETNSNAAEYQWLLNNQPIAGATTAQLEFGANGVTYESGIYQLNASACGQTITSVSIELVVNKLPTLVDGFTYQSDFSVCSGVDITLGNLELADNTGVSYEWFKNGTSIATSAELVLTTIDASDEGDYLLEVTNGCGTTSFEYTVNLSNETVITLQPQTTEACLGGNANLSVVATGVSGYQWLKNGVEINGATTANFNLIDLTEADAALYSVRVIGCSETITSAEVTLTISQAPAFTSTQESLQNITLCEGDIFILNENVTLDNTNGLSYSWLKDGANLNLNTLSFGLNNTNPVTPAQSGLYTFTATNACGSVSLQYQITVVPNPVVSSQPPMSNVVCSGDMVDLAVSFTNTEFITSYQWKRNNENILGANSALLSLTADFLGTNVYQLEVTNTCGKVATVGSYSVSVRTTPSILNDVVTGTSCTGSFAYIEAITLGSFGSNDNGMSYQWSVGYPAAPGTEAALLPIGNGNTLNLALDGRNTQIYLTVSNSCGTVEQQLMGNFTALPAPVLVSNPQSVFKCDLEPVTLTVEAQNGETYQWQRNNEAVQISESASYTATQSGFYNVIVSNCNGQVSSAVAEVSMNLTPTITLPADFSVCAGESVNLSATVSNAIGGIFWDRDVQNGVNFTPTATATYTVTANGGGDCVATASITVTVLDLPVPTITQNNGSLSTQAFESYFWFRNGTPIQGATAQSFTPSESGNYTVLVITAEGCEGMSAPLTVTVLGLANELETALRIFPNPARDVVTIQFEGMHRQIQKVEVFNNRGQILEIPLRDNQSLDMSSAPSGMYWIRIITDQGAVTRKIIRE